MTRINTSRGQAAVFVLLFLGVLTLSLVFVYKAGKVTTERMQVQNAADAVAYSVSTIEARDLNFIAYTNRAMIANEVAIGQMVGLASWLFNWKSYAAYLNAYRLYFLDPLVSAISLGTATVPFQNTFKGVV
ncbi:MAG: pilus assembly protein TadG-related protein, partial [Gammaproteobacteria bacterium]|nr:pilus assembly protein TadG-related protein [Gammaproteobacteria bacterium]